MKTLFKNRESVMENYGGRMILMQQKQSHSKKLSQIYSKKLPNWSSHSCLKNKKLKTNKKQEYQNRQHLKNIKHLFQFISRKKNIHDRFKDPNDFFAYPVYFFRQTKNTTPKNNTKTLINKTHHINHQTQSQQTQFTTMYGIDVPTVQKYLPALEQFTEKELEEYAGAITKLIITFELNSIQRIEFLKKCVLKTAGGDYPQLFSQIVQEIFQQVMQSIDLN